MKKILIFLMLSVITVLFIVSCASPEEAENRAAQALEQLSDDELQQLEDETAKMGEGTAIAGQGYKIPGAAVNVQQAARVLLNVNRNSRITIIQDERERRATAGTITQANGSSTGTRKRQDEPCTTANECITGLVCRYDSVTRRNTCQWNGEGALCTSGADCRTDLICGRNIERRIVCETPNQPRGSVCAWDYECQSGSVCYEGSCQGGERCTWNEECGGNFICGRNEAGQSACELPNQPFGNKCSPGNDGGVEECASGVCGENEVGYDVCEPPYQPVGSPCGYRGSQNYNECAFGLLCGRNIEGRTVCELPNQPLGSSCVSDGECTSGICGLNEADQEVCESPGQPLESPCREDKECEGYPNEGHCGVSVGQNVCASGPMPTAGASFS